MTSLTRRDHEILVLGRSSPLSQDTGDVVWGVFQDVAHAPDRLAQGVKFSVVLRISVVIRLQELEQLLLGRPNGL